MISVGGRWCPSTVRLVGFGVSDVAVSYGWMAIVAPADMHAEAEIAEVSFHVMGREAEVHYMRVDGKTGFARGRILLVCEVAGQRVLVPATSRGPFTEAALGGPTSSPPIAPVSRSRWRSAVAVADDEDYVRAVARRVQCV